MCFLEGNHRGNMLFSSPHQGFHTINMTYHCGCWPWSSVRGSVCQLPALQSYFFSSFPTILFGRNSLKWSHTCGISLRLTSELPKVGAKWIYCAAWKNAIRWLISLSFHSLQQDYGRNVKTQERKKRIANKCSWLTEWPRIYNAITRSYWLVQQRIQNK